MLAIRGGLDEEARKRAGILLTERILGHQWFYRSEILLGFASYGSEINTYEILGEALKAGKQVYLPKVLTKAHGEPEMVFLRIHSLQELCSGYKGIPEPSEQAPEYRYAASATERAFTTGILRISPRYGFGRSRLASGVRCWRASCRMRRKTSDHIRSYAYSSFVSAGLRLAGYGKAGIL